MTLLDRTPTVAAAPRLDGLPVAIIGAGPIGLAAAAHLAERGQPFVLYEAGTIADSMRSWGHIRLFSPWKHLVDPASRRLLEARGWTPPQAHVLPTGAELVEHYLTPLAELPEIAPHLRTETRVVSVTREGMDRTRSAGRATTPFVLRIADDDTGVTEVTARAVIDASGTYRNANSLSSNGLSPLGIDEVADSVFPALPNVLGADRSAFAGKRTVVVGAGHSAANTLLNLAVLAAEEPGTEIVWVLRNAGAVRVTTSPDDELQARASLGARVDALVDAGVITVLDRFEISRLGRGAGNRVAIMGSRLGVLEQLEADVVVNATGFRPDLGMLREIRLELDGIVEAPKRLAPLIDPNVHTCGTVEPHGFAELEHPEPDFFLAGMKSYGRAPTFLLATGYEQVRSITAWLSGDAAAAMNVELVLPATGVCSTDRAGSSSCC